MEKRENEKRFEKIRNAPFLSSCPFRSSCVTYDGAVSVARRRAKLQENADLATHLRPPVPPPRNRIVRGKKASPDALLVGGPVFGRVLPDTDSTECAHLPIRPSPCGPDPGRCACRSPHICTYRPLEWATRESEVGINGFVSPL